MAKTARDQAGRTEREAGPPLPPRRRAVAPLVVLAAALVLVLDGIVGQRGLLENRRAEARFQAAQHALEDARQRNAVLREEMRRLKEDPAAIDEAARRDLGLMKPGEKLFIVRDLEKADTKK